MTRRYYSSIATPTTLTAGINSSTTSVPVAAVTGFPSSYPYTIILDKDTASEEIVTVTSRSGLTLTATRGVGGTTGVAHSSGGSVTHGVYDADFEDAAAHVAETTTAHGLTLANVLTTTNTKSVTNKTLDSTNVIAQAAVTNLTSDLALKADVLSEKGADGTITTGVLTLDVSAQNVLYVPTAPTANFTVNVTNAPTTADRAITVTVFVVQGATGYIPNVVQVAGTPVTIKWLYGAAPTPTSTAGKIDVFSFTLYRRSAAWTVFGQAGTGF